MRASRLREQESGDGYVCMYIRNRGRPGGSGRRQAAGHGRTLGVGDGPECASVSGWLNRLITSAGHGPKVVPRSGPECRCRGCSARSLRCDALSAESGLRAADPVCVPWPLAAGWF